MWDYFFAAFAIMLVFEGMLPFLCPKCWRSWVTNVMQSDDRTLRIIGFTTMILGVGLLYIIKLYFGD